MSEVVVITGASAGVGRATACAFARRGASVGLIARDSEGLYAAAREIERLGGRAKPVAADVADAAAVEAAAGAIEQAFGPIDVWINDAMATIYAPFSKLGADEFRRATEVTYLGFVYGTMAALKRMRQRNRGTIVQVGSALSYRAIPLQAPYCGAKFAVRGFTDAVRCELMHERSNVHITMVQMPALDTPQFEWGRNKMPCRPQPVPPIFEPEVAARAILFAAHARRREVWVGGSTVLAILANKLAPAIADRYLAAQGYGAQQTAEPAPVDAPDNLYAPVRGLHRTRGRFGSRARSQSMALEASMHKWMLVGAALLLLATSAAARPWRAGARRGAAGLGRSGRLLR